MTLDARGHWTLDPEVIQLNHGSFGACPEVVLGEQESWRRRLERQPTGFYAELEAELDRVKDRIGELVGAARDDLALIPNTTTGVNAVLRSLSLERSDEILITDHGYNACNNAADFVAERAGATVVRATLPFPITSPEQAIDAIVAAITPRTKIALVDHITSVTALVLPIERIAAELAAANDRRR